VSSVSIQHLSKRFGSRRALRDVSLEIADGEFLCLLGPSGAGKTTLMRCIAGLETPDDGDIHFNDESILDKTPAQRDVAMVFASYALYPHLTVFENIAYPLQQRRIASTEVANRVHRVAESLRITDTLDRLPSTCSGGEMQRIALGRALVREARVYLFDEPLSNLDAQLREEMRSELKRLHRELGNTLIYATPDQLEALSMPNRVAVFRDGRVQQCGSTDDVYLRPANAFVAAYVGDPPMNLLSANATASRLRTAFFEVPFNGVADGNDYLVGVRPEDVRLGDAPEAYASVSFVASVYTFETYGDFGLLTLERDDTRLKILTDGAFGRRSDRDAKAWIPLERLYVMNQRTDAVL
jgi:multiple sugar transport system ATP-binding protein